MPLVSLPVLSRISTLRRVMSCAAVLGAVAGAAAANDSVAELSTGGLVLTGTAEIQMAREDLRIGPDQIAVDYVFRNITSRDITATVAFPMPDIDEEEGQMHAIPGGARIFWILPSRRMGNGSRPR